jgi:hypothetical protein
MHNWVGSRNGHIYATERANYLETRGIELGDDVAEMNQFQVIFALLEKSWTASTFLPRKGFEAIGSSETSTC